MADVVGRAVITVGADASGFTRDLSGRLRNAQGQFVAEGAAAGTAYGNAMQRTMSQQLSSAGKKMTGVGKKLSLGITAPLVGVGAFAIKTAASFDQSMNVLQAATGSTGNAMTKMRAQAIDLGAKTVFSANDAADAMVELGKAGQNSSQIMKTVPQVMNLAATEGMNLGDAAGVVTSALAQFNLNASKSGVVVNALAGASNASKASVSGLAQSFSLVGSAAHGIGASVQQTAGALAALAQGGLEGSIAGTSLASMFNHLQPQTKAAANTMKSLGINFVNANGSFKSIAQIAQILQTRLGGLTPAARKVAIGQIFGRDASVIAAVNALMQAGGKGIRDYTKASSDMGAAQRLAQARMKGTAGAIEQMKGSLETAALTIGEALAPAVAVVSQVVQKLAGAFTSLPKGVQTAIVVFGGLAAALGPILVMAGSVISAVGAIGGAIAAIGGAAALAPIAGVVAALVGVGVILVELWKNSAQFRDMVIGAWNSIKAAVLPAITSITAMIRTQLMPALASIWTSIKPVVEPLVAFFAGAFLQSVVMAVRGITNVLRGLVQIVTGVVQIVAGLLKGNWSQAWQGVKNVVGGAVKVVQGFVQLLISRLMAIFPPLRLLAPAFRGLMAVVRTVAGAIGSALAGAFRLAVAVMRPVATVIRAVLVAAFKFLANIVRADMTVVRTVVTVGVKAVRAALNLMSAGVRAVAAAVRSGMASVRAAFSSAFATIRGVVSSGWRLIRSLFTSGMTAIAGAVRSGVSRVVGAFHTLASGITGAVRGLASQMYSIGLDVMRGLLNGITAGASAVLSKAESIASSVKSKIAGALHIGSPSKDLIKIGQFIMQGWQIGITKGGKPLLNTLGQIADKLKKAGEKHGAAVVAAFTKALGSIPKTYDTVAGQIKTATATLATLQAKVADTASSVVDSFQLTGFDLSSVAPHDQFQAIVKQFTQARDTARQWAQALNTLQKQGLRKDLFDQFVQAGPSALGEVQAIISAGGVKQINTLQSQLAGFATQAGVAATKSMSPGGVAAAQSFLDTLKSRQAVLTRQFDTIADRFGKRLRAAVNKTQGGVTLRSTPSAAAPRAAATTTARKAAPAPAKAPAAKTAAAKKTAAPAERSVTVNQNFYGPQTGRDRARELRWAVRYSPR